jgi:peptidoglycan/LPS O-acetylase OafA/YrhL
VKHIPALDGLRAIAVTMVLLFHAWGDQVRGGFIGVDVFFVLSGFLITRLFIVEAARTGTINLRYFFMRRALRLMPCLWLVIGAMLGFAYLVDPPNFFRLDIIDAVCALTYVTNWHLIIEGDRRNLFGHTWSLAIEEQFYIAWAVVAYWLRRAQLRDIALFLSGTILCLDIWRWFIAAQGASYLRLYAGFDVRADELLGGCAAAAVIGVPAAQRALERLTRSVALGPAALAALVSITAFDFGRPGLVFWYGPLLTILTVAVLFDIVLNEQGFVARLLSWRPLVYVGSISYGLYLWHDPMMYYFKSAEWYVRGAIAFVVAPVLAAGSYRYVEKPALLLKRRFEPMRQAAMPSASATTARNGSSVQESDRADLDE